MNQLILKLMKEKEELCSKLVKLRQFMSSDAFDLVHPVQQRLLREQSVYMNHYHHVLLARIQHLEEIENETSTTVHL